MKLKDILEGIKTEAITGDPDREITGISYDSRKVRKGDLFVAIRGEHVDGHDFVRQAAGKGAAAVMYEHAILPADENFLSRTLVQVEDSRRALALASGNFFRRPSQALTVIGVTGTNGKTTTTYIIKSILEAWGKTVGLIGTIHYMIREQITDATHTTPESLEFQSLLHDMAGAGCSHVVTEVSSHALAQKRVDGTIFRAGVFTNLTRDHLDFHGTMEEYFESKKRFFTDLLERHAVSVINYDDVWGRRLIGHVPGNVYTYGLETGADLVATDINNAFGGLTFRIMTRGRTYDVTSPLVGLPNVYNILSAAGAAASVGVPWDRILEGIRKSPLVRGRFEKVDAGQRFFAIVDYAHTEDAIERLIYTARGLTKGKIITVFGCGGDRDRGKRPKMGAIATRLSDFVVLTSDNPRTEKAGDIIADIERGAVRRNYLIEPDRREAIRRAVMIAEENDVLLVAGKGHEIYQEIEGKRYPFNDREVLEESIRHLIINT